MLAELTRQETGALEEIKTGMMLAGGPREARMNLGYVKGSGSWNDHQTVIWRRFRDWERKTVIAGMKRERDAALLYAAGCGFAEIERELRIRRGHGKARGFILKGLSKYVELAGWGR